MTYILAEVASAHAGDPQWCIDLVKYAHEAGADGVKLQVWFPDELVAPTESLLAKQLDWDYVFSKIPRDIHIWGQYYGDKSREMCLKYHCSSMIDGYYKKGFCGVQNYPTMIADSCLKRIGQKHGDITVDSYADHTAADDLQFRYMLPAMAVARGAKLIEKHICLNREELKPLSRDWVSALEPYEFKEFVEIIREAEAAL